MKMRFHGFSMDKFLVYFNNHLISRIFILSIKMCWYKYFMRFSVGDNTSIFNHFKVATIGKVKIGSNTVINNNCCFDNRFPITIGSNVSISYGTKILTKGHLIDDPLFKTCGQEVEIEDYVWICTDAMILPGVKIGEGAVVLPRSVVVNDVSPYSVVGGVPAKHIRKRNRALKYKLNFVTWVPFWG